MNKYRIVTVIGARPQLVKVAVISNYLKNIPKDQQRIEEIIVHTGQHYDHMLSGVFFEQLNIPKPKINLGIGSGLPEVQLGKMVHKIGEVVREEQPDAVLVYGDTNSTLAAAIVSVQQNLPLIHVEAGERIYRRNQVPEEINRVLTDHASSLCLTVTERAGNYLIREGFHKDRIKFVGDPMFDLFCWGKSKVDQFSDIDFGKMGISAGNFHLATIHRAQNTDSKEILLSLLSALDNSPIPVVLPIHPRVKHLLEKYDWQPSNNLKTIEPQGYFDFLKLLLACKYCITDSGGVTREAFFARKPCIVPMENCWWSQAVESGWAIEVNTDTEKLLSLLEEFPTPQKAREDAFGDGNSAEKIIREVVDFLDQYNGESYWHRSGKFEDLPATRKSDLTFDNYSDLLEAMEGAKYRFVEPLQLMDNSSRKIAIVHQVLFNPENSLKTARIENSKGIKACYCLDPETKLDNLFSRDISGMIQEIIQLGHSLGLVVSTDMSDKVVSDYIALIENWFKCKVSILFYKDNGLIKALETGSNEFIPVEYLEAELFQNLAGYWQPDHPLKSKAFNEGSPILLSLNPGWFQPRSETFFETLLKVIDKKEEEISQELTRQTKSDLYQRKKIEL